jgi:hypothetical protein
MMMLMGSGAGEFTAIGTYFGHTANFPTPEVPPPPDVHGMKDFFTTLSVLRFIKSLPEVPESGPLHHWNQAAHATRASSGREAPYTLIPLKAYDAIFFLHTFTPSLPPHD